MSITDELRVFAKRWPCTDYIHKDMLAIADRIDAEHERGMAAAALIAGVPMTEENMAEHGWVRGPLDADGEMWHSGDMSDSNWGVIEGIAFENGRWFISGHDTSAPWIPADSIRHHHAPTVEDVLTEFAEKITDSQIPGVHPTYEEAIAEYAQRLQLREVDE